MTSPAHRACALLATLAGLAACQRDLDDIDGIFYDGDRRLVHCAVDLDTTAHTTYASIDSGLDRAVARGEVLELYAHNPGGTVPVATIEHVLAGAAARGLRFVTYDDYAREAETGPVRGPGLALSFDDTFVDAWLSLRPLFQQYDARVTFFVSRFHKLNADRVAGLRTLSEDGHAVGAHTVNHLRAPDYVEDHGLATYLREELDPSIVRLRDAGFPVQSFAYPFGARTTELDDAIAKRVPVIRSVSFSYPEVSSPCPR